MKTKQLIIIIVFLFISNMLVTGCGSWRRAKSEDRELRMEHVYQKDSLTQVSSRSDYAAIYEWLQSSAFSTTFILADSNLTIHRDKGIQLDKGSVLYLHRNEHLQQKLQGQSADTEDIIVNLQESSHHQTEEMERTINQRSRHPPSPLLWLGFFCCLVSLIVICYWKIRNRG